jgi:phosphosulfolactate phosphohydrolase-like enzyme
MLHPNDMQIVRSFKQEVEFFTSFKNCIYVASHIKEQRDFIHGALRVRDKVLAHYLFVFV